MAVLGGQLNGADHRTQQLITVWGRAMLPIYVTSTFIHLMIRTPRGVLTWFPKKIKKNIYIYIIQILCVCLSSIGGQTAGPIMTKFGTHMRIDLGMVPTKYWPHEWPGSVGSLGPISESGLSRQLLLRAVVWQMTSQLIRRRNDVVFAAFNQPVSVRPMNVQKINKTNVYPPHPGGVQRPGGGGWGVNISKVREISRTAEKIDKKNSAEKITKTCNPHPTPIRRGGVRGDNFKVTKLQGLKSISGMQLSWAKPGNPREGG